jgi:bifunctional DNA-binding transcriptional regulator/antitoxin component of YhaV-PrlF toxin-antitoxin module
LVIPRELRDRLGLRHGPVELEMDGADLRVRPVAPDDLTEADGLLVIPADDGGSITDEAVRALRDADRR